MTVQISDDKEYLQRVEVELISSEAISIRALEIAAKVITINPSIDIIHPGNFTQFDTVLPEYSVILVTCHDNRDFAFKLFAKAMDLRSLVINRLDT